MNNKKQYKTRWRYYIDKPFQNRFILKFITLAVISLIVTGGILFILNANRFERFLFSFETQPGVYNYSVVLGEFDKNNRIIVSYGQPVKIYGIPNIYSITKFTIKQINSVSKDIIEKLDYIEDELDVGASSIKEKVNVLQEKSENLLSVLLKEDVKKNVITKNYNAIVKLYSDINKAYKAFYANVNKVIKAKSNKTLSGKEQKKIMETIMGISAGIRQLSIAKRPFKMYNKKENTLKKVKQRINRFNRYVASLKGKEITDDIVNEVKKTISVFFAGVDFWGKKVNRMPDDLADIIPSLRLKLQKEAQMRYIPLNLFEVYSPFVIISSIVFIVLIVVFGLFESHRMAGPVYRIKRELTEIAEGKVNYEIKLRKRDEFKDLASAINKVIASIKQNSDAIYNALKLIKGKKTDKAVEVLCDTVAKMNNEYAEIHSEFIKKKKIAKKTTSTTKGKGSKKTTRSKKK